MGDNSFTLAIAIYAAVVSTINVLAKLGIL